MKNQKEILVILAKQKLEAEQRMVDAIDELEGLKAANCPAESIAITEKEAEKAHIEMLTIQESMHLIAGVAVSGAVLMEVIAELNAAQ